MTVGMAFSRGKGVDGVIITASTLSNDPVTHAARMCRKRGRIVLVGVAGLELNRPDFYEKELSFQVSCSYGPGRYDPIYEEKGQDYLVIYDSNPCTLINLSIRNDEGSRPIMPSIFIIANWKAL